MKTYNVTFNPKINVIVNDNASEEEAISMAIEAILEDATEYINRAYVDSVEECPKRKTTEVSNIKKYIDGQISTENGRMWRKENFQNAQPDEIVFIGELDLEILEGCERNDADLTDEELVEKHIADTPNTIRQTIKTYYPFATDEWIDRHNLVNTVIGECTWECTSTMIDRMAEWEDIWDDYPNDGQ